jgi:hypothetical protein
VVGVSGGEWEPRPGESLVERQRARAEAVEARVGTLLGQRAAARALHMPVSGMLPPTCSGCGTSDYDDQPTEWPCATAAALGASYARPYTEPYPDDGWTT